MQDERAGAGLSAHGGVAVAGRGQNEVVLEKRVRFRAAAVFLRPLQNNAESSYSSGCQ